MGAINALQLLFYQLESLKPPTFGYVNLFFLSYSKSIHISGCKFSFYFVQKTYFFLFYIFDFTKHPHQFIYTTRLFNKIFIFLQIFIILSPIAPSLSQTQQYQQSLHTQPPSAPTQPTSSRKINPFNPRNKHSKTHSQSKPSQSTPSTLWSHH